MWPDWIATKYHISRLYRRYLSGYAIRKWQFWIDAQLRNLSARPFGYRFLSVDKGDYSVMVYLNGSDESEKWAMSALVPLKAGIWGNGWVYRHKLGENGKPYQENGIVATECIHGRVMWRPMEKHAHS